MLYSTDYKILTILALLIILSTSLPAARTVPLFAVTADGKPVQDLVNDQLELLVDGKVMPFQLINLNSTKVARVVFVMIEARISSDTLLQRTREILKEMITRLFPGDNFVIMRGSLQQGVHFVIGPEKNRSRLLKKVERMTLNAAEQFDNMVLPTVVHDTEPVDVVKKQGSGEYLISAQRWIHSLTRLKYMMQALNGSKLFFLISPGLNGEASLKISGGTRPRLKKRNDTDYGPWIYESGRRVFDRNRIRSKQEQLTVTARAKKLKEQQAHQKDRPSKEKKALAFYIDFIDSFCYFVNAGGSVLHVINPGVPGEPVAINPGESLKLLSRHGGGNYFQARETASVVNEIKSCTAPYYQLTYNNRKKVAIELKFKKPAAYVPVPVQSIQLRSKGNDITLYYIRHCEAKVSYSRYSPFDKQLFAADILNKGTWSQVTGSFRKIKAYRLPDVIKDKKKILTLEIPILPYMMSRKADVYTVLANSNNEVLQINHAKRILTDRERISTFITLDKIDAAEPIKYSVVMIDPSSMMGIYNRVDLEEVNREAAHKKDQEERPKIDKPAANQDALPGILNDTASYCRKLEKEVYHFFCIEKVYESFQVHAFSDNNNKTNRVRSVFSNVRRIRYYRRRNPLLERGLFFAGARLVRKYRREYVNNYQIIKTDNKIKEKRELVKFNRRKLKKNQKPTSQAIVYSYKNAIYPVLLFAKKRQSMFNYTLLGTSRIMKRNAWVIEIKSPEVGNKPGKLLAISWVDNKDFSILKFQVYSAAFKGYTHLIRSGIKGMRDIKIKDVHYFGELRNGLRFPSKTKITISYKRKIKKGNEKKQSRSGETDYLIKLETDINYKKYLFYKVNVDDPVYIN